MIQKGVLHLLRQKKSQLSSSAMAPFSRFISSHWKEHSNHSDSQIVQPSSSEGSLFEKIKNKLFTTPQEEQKTESWTQIKNETDVHFDPFDYDERVVVMTTNKENNFRRLNFREDYETKQKEREKQLLTEYYQLPTPAVNVEEEKFTDMKTPFISKEIESNFQQVIPVVHLKNSSDLQTTWIDTPHGPLQVASFDNNSKMASVCLLFRSGIKYETTEDERGTAILLNKLSFKPSKNFSEEELKTLSNTIGYESSVEQEMFQYTVECYRQYIDQALALLGDTTFNPAFREQDVNSAIDVLQTSIMEQEQDPVRSAVLTDAITQACFGGSFGLGNSSRFVNPNLRRDHLFQFMRKYFRPERAVLVGLGVQHEQFVASAKKYFTFDHLNAKPLAEVREIVNPIPKWSANEIRIQFTENPLDFSKQNLPPLTAAVLAFPGYSYSDKEIYAIHVLEYVLGGGDSFSPGGPGKGLLSIINQRYIGQYDLFNMMAQHHAFADAGIFVIHASTYHQLAPNISRAILQLLSDMYFDIQEIDLQRAKNRFKMSLLVGMEDSISIVANLAADLLYVKKARGTDYLLEQVEKVTLSDIKQLIKKMFSSKPAMVVIGQSDAVVQKQVVENVLQQISDNLNRAEPQRLRLKFNK